MLSELSRDSAEVPGEVVQVVPVQPKKDHLKANIHSAAHRGPHAGASGCAVKESAAHGELMQAQGIGRSCGPWRGSHAGAGFLTVPWGPHNGAVNS